VILIILYILFILLNTFKYYFFIFHIISLIILDFDKNVLFFIHIQYFQLLIITEHVYYIVYCLQATRYFLLLVPQSVESVPFRRLSLL